LVHAAAGGTGLLLGQVLKDLGAHTIGTVSTTEKGKLAKEAGFEHIIESYDPEVVLPKVKELTNGEGVICVYDGVTIFYSMLINRWANQHGNFPWIVSVGGET
jgi:NADPH2:quinone reductase